MNLENKGRSPFYPGQPVPVELFVGRNEEIERLLRSSHQVTSGKQQAVFIAGEYGIGKSSLAHFVHAMLENRQALFGIHVFLGGAKTLEELAIKTVEAALETRIGKPSALESIRNVLADYVGEQGLWGVKVRFDKLKADAPSLSRGYMPFLRQVFERVQKEGYSGILLILDEINGIASNPDFSHFIKTLVDSNATSAQPPPLLLTVCGVEERRAMMIQHHRPIERVFDVITIEPMNRDQSEAFFQRAFDSVGLKVESAALSMLWRYSGGLPKLMHLVGDAAFWTVRGSSITRDDAIRAVLLAADDVGRRYFDRQVLGALQSKDYRGILKKLGGMELSLSFEKQDLEQRLTPREKGKLNNFLQRMKKLNVVRGVTRGEYEFNDWLTRIYIMMKAGPPSPPTQ